MGRVLLQEYQREFMFSELQDSKQEAEVVMEDAEPKA